MILTEDILKLLHQYKVRRYKTADFEVELDATAFSAASDEDIKRLLYEAAKTDTAKSDENMMLWSTPHYEDPNAPASDEPEKIETEGLQFTEVPVAPDHAEPVPAA